MRMILAVCYAFFATFFSYLPRYLDRLHYRNSKELHTRNFWRLQKIARRMLAILHIKVKVEGSLDLDEEGFLYIGNHKSNFDSLILIACARQPIMFIGKSEIRKFPFIGKWFVDIGCLFIERTDMKKSFEVIEQGAQRIAEGYSLVIFPEGSRTKEDLVRPFKPGSLKLATKTGASIVPITFFGSEDCYETYHYLHSAKVTLIVEEPINPKEKELKNTIAIAGYLHEMISGHYEKLKGAR